MLRAMDSAVSGLRAHQNKLDVIGNNIANVNTFGFKSQSYSFKEAMYQTSTTSTKGSENAGGVNAAQYGYHDKRMNDCLPPILFSAIFKLLKVLPDTELDAC